jgi:MFS transporter, DHA1 family, tetracycline resistance protein
MRQSSLLVIFLIVFIDLVGFGIVIPILPYYAQSFGASAWKLGWLMTVYSLAQFVFAPVWGRISDHVGRRPVLLVSLIGTVVSMSILGLAGSLKWLFIGRLFAGICTANISTAYAYVADITQDEERAKGMGIVGAGFGLGFIFGPAIGGLLSRYGFGMPMFAAALIALFNLIFAFFMLEERRISRSARAENRPKRFSPENLRIALGDSGSRIAIGIFFLVTFAVTQMEVVFAIYMKAVYGFDAQAAGFALAIMGLIMVMIQGPGIGPLVRRFGERPLVVVGALTCSLSMLGFALLGNIYLAITMLCLMALGHGVLHPTLSSLASKGANASRRGATMGIFHSASSLARVFGPPVAGWLYDRMSWRSPFLTASIFLAIAFVISLTWLVWQRRQPRLATAIK